MLNSSFWLEVLKIIVVAVIVWWTGGGHYDDRGWLAAGTILLAVSSSMVNGWLMAKVELEAVAKMEDMVLWQQYRWWVLINSNSNVGCWQ